MKKNGTNQQQDTFTFYDGKTNTFQRTLRRTYSPELKIPGFNLISEKDDEGALTDRKMTKISNQISDIMTGLKVSSSTRNQININNMNDPKYCFNFFTPDKNCIPPKLQELKPVNSSKKNLNLPSKESRLTSRDMSSQKPPKNLNIRTSSRNPSKDLAAFPGTPFTNQIQNTDIQLNNILPLSSSNRALNHPRSPSKDANSNKKARALVISNTIIDFDKQKTIENTKLRNENPTSLPHINLKKIDEMGKNIIESLTMRSSPLMHHLLDRAISSVDMNSNDSHRAKTETTEDKDAIDGKLTVNNEIKSIMRFENNNSIIPKDINHEFEMNYDKSPRVNEGPYSPKNDFTNDSIISKRQSLCFRPSFCGVSSSNFALNSENTLRPYSKGLINMNNDDMEAIDKRYKKFMRDSIQTPRANYPNTGGLTIHENIPNFVPKRFSIMQRDPGEIMTPGDKSPTKIYFSPEKVVRKIFIDKKAGDQANSTEALYSNPDFLSLKKDFPSLMSYTPATRHEILILTKWIDQKISSILEDQKYTNFEKAKKCDEIYNICLNEIFRQVTMDCHERGAILSKIWCSYIDFFDVFKEQLEEQINKTNQEAEVSYNRVHKMYKDILSQRDDEISQLKSELEKLLIEKENYTKEMEELFLSHQKNIEKLNDYKKFIVQAKGHISNLVKENEAYRTKNIFALANKNSTINIPNLQIIKAASQQTLPVKSILGESIIFPIKKSESQEKIKKIKDLPIITNSNSLDKKELVNHENNRNKESPLKLPELERLNLLAEKKLSKIHENKKPDMDSSENSIASSIDLVFDEGNRKEEIIKIDQLNLISNQKTDFCYQVADKCIQVCEMVIRSEKECQTNLILVNTQYNNILCDPKVLEELILDYKFKQELDIINEAKLIFPRNNATKPKENNIADNPDECKDRFLEEFLASSRMLLESVKKIKTQNHIGKARCNSLDSKNILEINWMKHYQKQLISKLIEDFGKNVLDSLGINIEQTIQKIRHKKLEKTMRKGNQGQVGFTTFRQVKIIKNDNGEVKMENDGNKLNLNDEIQSSESFSVMEVNEDSHTSDSETNNTVQKPKKRFEKKKTLPPEMLKRFISLPGINRKGTFTALDQIMVNNNRKTIKVSLRPQLYEEDKKKFLIRLFAENDKSKSRIKLLNAILDSKDSADHKAVLLRILKIYNVQTEKNRFLNQIIAEMHEYILETNNTIENLQNQIKILEDKVKENENALKKLEEFESQKMNTSSTLCSKCNGPLVKPNNPINEDDQVNLTDIEDELLNVEDNDPESETEIEGKGNGTGWKNAGLKIQKRKKSVILPEAPQLGRSKVIIEKKVNPAPLIIQKLKIKRLGNFKNFMPMKQALRLITQIYEERIFQTQENPQIKDEELSCFVFNLFLQNFGFKNIAQQKFIVFVLSIKKYLHIVRINLFARFMGLLESRISYTLDDFNKCIEMLEFVKKSTLGTTIINSETDAKVYTPFLRVLEYVKNFSENKLSLEEYQQFKKDFENLKENDPKNINRYGQIDIDLSVLKILAKYQLVCNRTKQYVKNAFKAADLDGNKTCSLKEFVLLYKYIEADKYDYDFVESIFHEHADVVEESGKALSFNKFTILCVEYSLFSDNQQNYFLQINNNDEVQVKFEELMKDWPLAYGRTLNILKNLKKTSLDDIDYWLGILNALDERIKSESDYKPFLIAYHIMIQEVNEFKEAEEEKPNLY